MNVINTELERLMQVPCFNIILHICHEHYVQEIMRMGDGFAKVVSAWHEGSYELVRNSHIKCEVYECGDDTYYRVRILDQQKTSIGVLFTRRTHNA